MSYFHKGDDPAYQRPRVARIIPKITLPLIKDKLTQLNNYNKKKVEEIGS